MSDRPSRPSSAPRRPGRSRPGGGFDRIKAPTRHAEPVDTPAGAGAGPEEGAAPADGRAALFEATGAPPPPPAAAPAAATPRPVPIAAVACRACGVTSPLDVLTVMRGLVPLVVVPWAEHPWWAVCPSCGQRTWLRPEVLSGGGR